MFMILKEKDQVVAKQVLAPKFKLKGKQPLRTRDGWAVQMYQKAVGWGSRYFAFRHGGRWWLYTTDAPERSAPFKEFPTQEAAEMWMHHRG